MEDDELQVNDGSSNGEPHRSHLGLASEAASTGVKRDISRASSIQRHDECSDRLGGELANSLRYLANQLSNDLNEPIANDSMHLSGLALIRKLSAEPEKVLKIAREHIFNRIALVSLRF